MMTWRHKWSTSGSMFALMGWVIWLAMESSCALGEDYGNVASSRQIVAERPNRPRTSLDWLTFKQTDPMLSQNEGVANPLQKDRERWILAAGFGLERPQAFDLGVYGKVGKATVFVASRLAISDYDRLYWVMVRVLSEKYGCFIVRKVGRRNNIGFACRDGRTVLMQRDISGAYAKFVGWQFDEDGRDVLITQAARARQMRFQRAKLRAVAP